MSGEARTAGLDHVALMVSEIERSVRFYEDVIGLKRVLSAPEPPVMMLAMGTGLALFPGSAESVVRSGNLRATGDVPHIAFRLNRKDFAIAREELEERAISSQVVGHGNSHSIYLRDPDGYLIELTTYEI